MARTPAPLRRGAYTVVEERCLHLACLVAVLESIADETFVPLLSQEATLSQEIGCSMEIMNNDYFLEPSDLPFLHGNENRYPEASG